MRKASNGGADWDDLIGSILERWLTTSIHGQCRFCRDPVDPKLKAPDQFCSPECRANWQKVMEARIVIGKRDLKKRGYD